MTVVSSATVLGKLGKIVDERLGEDGERTIRIFWSHGIIRDELSIGPDIQAMVPLISNKYICRQGVKLVGDGFIVNKADQIHFKIETQLIRPLISNRDFVQKSRQCAVIDANRLTETALMTKHPNAYQYLIERVKPERIHNQDAQRRRNWWLFGRTNQEMREAIHCLERYIVTPEVAKHRIFGFVKGTLLPDASLYVIGTDDAYILSILVSNVHVEWCHGRATLEDRPRYQNGPFFDPFPFPDPDEGLKARLRELGEQLDAHRKARQAAHPGLTLTQMYNVLEKLKAGETLTTKDKDIHEQGLVSVLLDLHRRIDALVLEAYGWPADLDEAAMLERLVALNAERAEEERQGHIRWLRPEFQAPRAAVGTKPVQEEMGIAPAATLPTATSWPKKLPDRFQAMKTLLAQTEGTIDARLAAKAFKGARRQDVEQVLETLVAFGEARALGNGRFAA